MDIPENVNIADYQLDKLNIQLAYAAERSRFYREKLAGVDLPLKTLADLQRLPFTTAQDIAGHGAEMVCGGAGLVSRIVTIHSTGTGGAPKRLFFSEADLKRTEDFFTVGMRYMCDAGDRVMIFMPADSENGIGQLLVRGLTEIGVIPAVYGLISDFTDAAAALRQCKYHTVIGVPSQMRKLALLAPDIRPVNVLLSADYLSDATRETICRVWDCEVFAHYGLTETGYGCAVECPAHDGQHIRHDELLIEIVGPEWTGPAPGIAMEEAGWGEVVVTTLRREAMPLIRYRTGDLGRLIQGKCACGSELPKLDKVRGRLQELRHSINIYRMDELLLRRDDVLDYQAVMAEDRLTVTLEAAPMGTMATGAVAEAEVGRAAQTDAIAFCEDILCDAWPEARITVKLSDSLAAPARPTGWTVKRGIERIGNISVL